MRRFLRPDRTAVDAAVDELMAAIPPAAECKISAVVGAAESVCGEPIVVKHETQPVGRYGMCVRTAEGHVIYLASDLSGDLRSHTVLHELGHVLLGHNDLPVARGRDRLTAHLTGEPQPVQTCIVPQYREWAQRENDAERFASTVGRRWRRGMNTRHLSRLDEAFG